MKSGKSFTAMICQVVMIGLIVAGCGSSDTPQLLPAEAMKIAVDAYIYGYPLVTFDLVRQQQTNVVTADPEHAPMGQMIKMRSYPAVDNHWIAPHFDHLSHRCMLWIWRDHVRLLLPHHVKGNQWI